MRLGSRQTTLRGDHREALIAAIPSRANAQSAYQTQCARVHRLHVSTALVETRARSHSPFLARVLEGVLVSAPE